MPRVQLAAIEAVKNGTATLRAAWEHGVPRTTLYDRVSGKVVHGTKPWPSPYTLHHLKKKSSHSFWLTQQERDTENHERRSKR